MRSSDCEIVLRLSEIVLCRSNCSRRKSRRLFKIEERILHFPSELLSERETSLQGGSAIGLSATDALAEPQPVTNDNLHHLIPFHQTPDRGQHCKAAGLALSLARQPFATTETTVLKN